MAVGKKQLHRQQQPSNAQFRKRNPNFKPKPGDARENLRKSSIVKSTAPSASGSSEVRLYTTHFDARSKISQKKGIKQQSKSAAQVTAKKAVNNARKGINSGNRSNIPKIPSVSTNKKNTNTNNNINNPNRETTFTGKSIQISTTNDLAPRERKALMRGKSLSVITKNKPVKPIKGKQLNKTINNSVSTAATSAGPSHTSPEPIAPVLNKKTIPAKLVISNLHPNVTQDDILELFGAIGALRDGRLKSVGTAEVVYRVAEDAFAAYSKYHGRNLDGQPMILKITTADEAGSSNFLSPSSTSTRQPPERLPARQTNKVQGGLLSSTYSSFSNNAKSSGPPVVFTVKL